MPVALPPLPSRFAFRAAAPAAAGLMLALCSCGAGQSPVDSTEPAPVASPVAPRPAPEQPGSPPVVSSAMAADPSPQARSTLQGTIEEAIGLLRSRDYRTLIEQFVDPSDLAKFKAREGGTESLTQEFADSDKPMLLLDTLTSIRGATPELSQDGDEATFHTDSSVGNGNNGQVRFHRVDGRWYLRN